MKLLTLLLVVVLLGPAAEAATKLTVDQKVRKHIRLNWTADWRQQQALSVGTCESGLNPWAKSPAGHWGVFQMGSYERSITGWKWQIKYQLRAAKRYWVLTGRDWGAWSCQP